MDSVVVFMDIVALVIFFKMITILINLKGQPDGNKYKYKNQEKGFHCEYALMHHWNYSLVVMFTGLHGGVHKRDNAEINTDI